MVKIAPLPARGVIEVTGDDRVSFLQGLVSNDVAMAAPGRAVWAALLSAQGKWQADFFILFDEESLLLDVERAQAPMLVQRLQRFRLRAKVALRDLSESRHVFVGWDGMPAVGGVMAPDPRLDGAGWRIVTDGILETNAIWEDWDARRLALGLPDGSADLESDKSVLLEAGFDELNGVSWSKGCYMGQELTARTKYRGLVKRRLVPVDIAGPVPPAGTPVLRDGTEVGTLRSARDQRGLANLRLGAIGAERLVCGAATLRADLPEWVRLPTSAG